jgi:DNA-binding CsgD family transcriptional regulator
MSELEQIGQEYFQTISQQVFDISQLNYTIFEKQIPFLNQMASIKNSGISVFDFHKKEHIYNSNNMQNLFGYDLEKIEELGTKYYDSRIHPEDYICLLKNGISLIKYYFTLPANERKDFKLQNEYRILNSEDKYIKVIEQQQVLELDSQGNLWLALSVLDISPNQDVIDGIISQLVNVKTGETKQFELAKKPTDTIELSKREKQVLSYVKEGLLSKEISSNLSISVHTVNTHRQNILKKLGANNSFEAVEYATKLRLA